MQWSKHFTFKIQHEPGFRFNLIDVGLLALVGVMTYLLSGVAREGYLFLLPLYVGATFFFFCNVFRIGNRMERFWYFPFIIVVLLLHNRPVLLWWLILLVLEPLKVLLVVYCIRKGGYHGAWASKLARTK